MCCCTTVNHDLNLVVTVNAFTKAAVMLCCCADVVIVCIACTVGVLFSGLAFVVVEALVVQVVVDTVGRRCNQWRHCCTSRHCIHFVGHTIVLLHLVLALAESLTSCRPLFCNLLQDDQVGHKCSILSSDSFLFLCCLLCSFLCPCVLCSVVRAAIVLVLLTFLCWSWRSLFRNRSLFLCCCTLFLFLCCCPCTFLCLFLLLLCMLLLCPLVLYRHQGSC